MTQKRTTSPFKRMPGPAFTFEKVDVGGVGKSMDALLRQIGITRATPGGRDEVENPLTDSWVVYACVQALTDAVRQVPICIWESDAEDAQEVGEDHPIRRLFNVPNPDMGLSDLLAAGMMHRKLSGEDWWFLMDGEGKPVSPSIDQRSPIPLPTVIYPVSGEYVEDSRDGSTGRITAVQYGASGATPPVFPVGSTVHFYDYNPADPMRGMSPLDAALRVISVGFQTERYQESVMRGGGPGAFLKYEEGMSNDEEFRLQESANEAMRDPDVVGGFKVLTGKVDVIPNPATPKDMLQRETLGWVRDTVCSVLQVPPPVIGNYDAATYSNVSEAYRQFWQSVKGYLDAVAEKINSHMLGRLADPRLAGCYVTFDYSGILSLQEDQSAKFKLAADLAGMGVGLSFNDAARMLGLEVETVGSASTVFVPMSSVVFGENDQNTGEMSSAAAVPAPVAAPEVPPAEAAALAEQLRAASMTKQQRSAALRAAFPSLSVEVVERLIAGQLETREGRVSFIEGIYSKTLDNAERRLAADVLTWLRRYERAQKAKLRDFAENGPSSSKSAGPLVVKAWTQKEVETYLLLNQEEWAAQLDALISGTLTQTWAKGLADTAETMGMVSMEVTNPKIIRLIAEQRAQIVEGVNSRLADEIRDRLLKTLAGPTSSAQIQGQIMEVLPELDDELQSVFGTKEARALTISRTETGKAYNSASFEEYRDKGVQRVMWVASNDATTRESHRELDGQTVAVGESFKAGLRFPGDPQGAPEEVINCRCALAPVV